MAVAVFDYQEFQGLIERFSAEIPGILASHHTTASLVPKVVDLLNIAESPFTVAIVGQMRVGKSSLLNALVGDDLAVTGVTETTATINWFKYGDQAQSERFRVVWKDRPAEDFSREEIRHWIGDSSRAEATKYIEFFANSDFLRRANIVDTPGTRSAIESHEATTQDFLALKREQETRREGDSADAIVYVLMPVARQNDQDLLKDFESGTRLTGSFPYNSLAVMHKWETLEVDDPLEEAMRKAETISASMANLVARVVPVSAPLAMAAERFGREFWGQLLDLVSNSTASALEQILLSDKFFVERNISSCALDQSARKRIREHYRLPWATFKQILRLASKNKPSTTESLRSMVFVASGIGVLREELEQRFFSRSKMIKAFSILAKAWAPCQIASGRLRNYKVRRSNLQKEAGQALSCLSEQIANGFTDLVSVQNYVTETRQLVEDDLKKTADVLRDLDEAQLCLRDAYEDMNADVKMLEYVDRHLEKLDDKIADRLRCLFGYRGPDIETRILPWQTHPERPISMDDIQSAISDIKKLRVAAKGELRQAFDHAEIRLEQIADWFEQQQAEGVAMRETSSPTSTSTLRTN